MGALYAMRDTMRDDIVPRQIPAEKALEFNLEGYGIFRTVNEFEGRRLKENLKRIVSWHVDMDGDKKEQKIKINASPLFPSRIVESANGYHLYFAAKDATAKNHDRIQLGLIDFFGGDKKARMLTALLREPGFMHLKDPANPFRVQEIYSGPFSYSELDMLTAFPPPPMDGGLKKNSPRAGVAGIKFNPGDDLTDFLNSIDNEWALDKLSGTSYVNGEIYTFRPVAKNRKNILVNGISTSCFIDENKRIGAIPGGPTIWQWLKFFQHSDIEIYRILGELFGGGS